MLLLASLFASFIKLSLRVTIESGLHRPFLSDAWWPLTDHTDQWYFASTFGASFHLLVPLAAYSWVYDSVVCLLTAKRLAFPPTPVLTCETALKCCSTKDNEEQRKNVNNHVDMCAVYRTCTKGGMFRSVAKKIWVLACRGGVMCQQQQQFMWFWWLWWYGSRSDVNARQAAWLPHHLMMLMESMHCNPSVILSALSTVLLGYPTIWKALCFARVIFFPFFYSAT